MGWIKGEASKPLSRFGEHRAATPVACSGKLRGARPSPGVVLGAPAEDGTHLSSAFSLPPEYPVNPASIPLGSRLSEDMPPNQNPEQASRDRIDRMLAESGWAVQDKKAINFVKVSSALAYR